MKATNWIRSGRASKQERRVIHRVSGIKKGNIGDVHWDDYVQLSFYDKNEDKRIMVTMAPEEAKVLLESLSKSLAKF